MTAGSTTAGRDAAGLGAVGLLALGALGLLGGRLLNQPPWGQAPPARIEQWVELAVLTAGLVVAAWVALSVVVTVACVAASRLGRRWRPAEALLDRIAPAVVRRLARGLLGAGVGAGLAISPTAALAADTDGLDPGAGVVVDLGWQSTSPEADDDVAPPPEPDPEPDPEPEVPEPTKDVATDLPAEVVVVRGDTLWAIAASHLGSTATDPEILQETTRWHAANRAVIGADPDLILPGQVLRAP